MDGPALIASRLTAEIALKILDKDIREVSKSNKFRVFATCDFGEALELLRQRGYELEVFGEPIAPPKSLIVQKVKSGIDGLITTLRDQIDAEIFEAGKGTLKVVAQYAVGFDNINRADEIVTKSHSPTRRMFSPKRRQNSPSSCLDRWRGRPGLPNI